VISARCRLAAVLASVTCAVAFIFVPTQAAAAPAPAWRISQAAIPTNLSPGSKAPATTSAKFTAPLYHVVLTNLGGAATTGTVVVTDTLPTGVSPALSTPAEVFTPEAEGGEEVKLCAPPAGQVITCTVAAPVGAAGGKINITIPIDVSAALAESVVTNQVAVSGGGAPSTSKALASTVTTVSSAFDFLPGDQGLAGMATDEEGVAATQAGSHPFALTLSADFPAMVIPGAEAGKAVAPVGRPRNLVFSLPQGVVGNPLATERCTEAQLGSENPPKSEGCPLQSQVGIVQVFSSDFNGATSFNVPFYNMVPPPGVPAQFGFGILGTLIHVQAGLTGDFHITAATREILAKIGILGVQATLWGSPSDARHDFQRRGAGCRTQSTGQTNCPVPRTEASFLTMPSACSGPLSFSASASSWEDPPEVAPRTATAELSDLNGEPVSITGCGALQFHPSITVRPVSHAASSPTGLDVNLEVPQDERFSDLATANLKKVVVTLPQGMAVNPAAADGLGACSPAQIGLGTNLPQTCPGAAKIGSAEIATPLLEGPIQGSVFLAQQRANPFGSLLALYLAFEGQGIVVKIAGRVDPNPVTGQLTATFDENPELPFSDLQVHFNPGARAPLVTPSACGTYYTRAELTSWASPTPVVLDTPMTIDQGCAAGGFSPGLSAGTTDPTAGGYSPFILRVTRTDGEQNLARIDATLPEGLLAKLAGIPLCGDAEAATGNCPAGSQVGTTTAGVGAGTQPLYIPQPGKSPTAVYIAGPYKGAPYSLVVKVPAQAGPFDLGTIAVRVALNVDPYSAQVTASSDTLPQILEGIPVAYRDVRVDTNRPNFILNPTSCEPMKVTTTLSSIAGATSSPSARFQVAGCGHLKFKPKLALSVKGATKRNGHPALKAVVTFPKGSSANIARAQVGLPHSEFLEQNNIKTVCKQAQLREDTCPKGSIYGRAKAWTPLLDKPLTGPVYLGVGFGHTLPDLVADLNGQIRVLVHGKVDTDKQEGLRNTFEAVPDAPVSKFVLEMNGGKKKGLIVNSTNICKGTHKAEVRFTAYNGKVETFEAPIANSCKGKGKK
jgi:hypothetical protein